MNLDKIPIYMRNINKIGSGAENRNEQVEVAIPFKKGEEVQGLGSASIALAFGLAS